MAELETVIYERVYKVSAKGNRGYDAGEFASPEEAAVEAIAQLRAGAYSAEIWRLERPRDEERA